MCVPASCFKADRITKATWRWITLGLSLPEDTSCSWMLQLCMFIYNNEWPGVQYISLRLYRYMHNLPTSRKSRSTGLTREENVLSENPVDNNAAGKKCFNNCKKKKKLTTFFNMIQILPVNPSPRQEHRHLSYDHRTKLILLSQTKKWPVSVQTHKTSCFLKDMTDCVSPINMSC